MIYYISTSKITGLILTDKAFYGNDTILHTPPIWRKWKGKKFDDFIKHFHKNKIEIRIVKI